MKVKSKIYNSTLYILLSGELDSSTASYAREEMDEACSSGMFKQIIIDLSELEFMDSTGIGLLIGRYKKMQEMRVPIYICNPSSHAEKIFKMSGLYELMPKIG